MFQFQYNGVSFPRLAGMIFKRLRPALGFALGFTLMAGALLGILSWHLLLFAFSFFLIYLASDLYNDYCDYGEDIRNSRREKFTVSGILSLHQVLMLSLSLLLIGFALTLVLQSLPLLLFALFSALLFFAYSDPRIRLKRYNLAGYIIFSSVFLLLPAALLLVSGAQLASSLLPLTSFPLTPLSASPLPLLPLSLFLFFQTVYLLCQKDSTDMFDSTNLFLARGKSTSLLICALFASLSLASLFALSSYHPLLIYLFAADFAAKALNLANIYKGPDPSLRSNISLFEHSLPYLSSAVIL